ncbi:RluA family pseudouridine synthase [Oleidesulfovibrio sp.]|uniref:RluA family pseudouridine synthase n=1 Tax=Oleidesulfovibrio sp. TaxID=2909707 RepID=UPI003A8823E5
MATAPHGQDSGGKRQEKGHAETGSGVQHLTVSQAEAGQKLLQFLQRRLGKEVPQGFLMRIIRKGEVRLNKGRMKPYDRVAEGDIVRVPPVRDVKPSQVASEPVGASLCTSSACGMVVARSEGLLVLNKPAGLPVQPGTGHKDCITARLNHCFANADFTPAPAHRLDKNTSGLLLVGTTYARLRQLQDLFRDGHAISKEYCAWVEGDWPYDDTQHLHDELVKDASAGEAGQEKVRALTADDGTLYGQKTKKAESRSSSATGGSDTGQPAKVRDAHCAVTPLLRRDGYTLMHIALFTGRTHQIRVQLSSRGYPVVGDGKYGGAPCSEGMLLHAFRITLPEDSFAGESFSCLPAWKGRWAVEERDLPE